MGDRRGGSFINDPDLVGTWTKGLIHNHTDKLDQRYEIREIDGESYLFLEWKMPGSGSQRPDAPYYALKEAGS